MRITKLITMCMFWYDNCEIYPLSQGFPISSKASVVRKTISKGKEIHLQGYSNVTERAALCQKCK